MKDTFGDRMKMYEGKYAQDRFMPLLPVCVRLDGKGFSSYTKKLKRPYDERFSNIMIEVTKYLVKYCNAKIGYTQSDEISLILYSDSVHNSIFFDGKVQKIISTLSSVATAVFNKLANDVFDSNEIREYAFFDCRAWVVPNKMEAVNNLLWREKDATKNSVSMATREYYTHSEVHGKNTNEMKDMLFAKGVNWNDYPSFFKRGTYIKRQAFYKSFTDDELNKIPEQHRPTGMILRHDICALTLQPLSKVTNLIDVVFGEDVSPEYDNN